MLLEGELVAILRAADELIMAGGRTLLSRVLKGSRERKVLEQTGFMSQLRVLPRIELPRHYEKN